MPQAESKRIYIAGPMSGYDDFNYPAFMAMEAELLALGWEVVNPATISADVGTGQPDSVYHKRNLPILIECDAVILLPFWELSHGASIEWVIADMCGLLVIEEPMTWSQAAQRAAEHPRPARASRVLKRMSNLANAQFP